MFAGEGPEIPVAECRGNRLAGEVGPLEKHRQPIRYPVRDAFSTGLTHLLPFIVMSVHLDAYRLYRMEVAENW